MLPEESAGLDTRWVLRHGDGPVLATAVHAGHELRADVASRSALSDEVRLREEDPLTDVLATVGDDLFVSYVSRFEVDLNRPADEAVYEVPSDAWGLELWEEPLPSSVVDASLASHSCFYDVMAERIEDLIEAHGRVLLLDVHSFNHARRDEHGDPLPVEDHPDIDLGLSTADGDRFGGVIDALWTNLADTRIDGRAADVRENVRFPDGGNWPEWVFARYGEDVCTITLEYKKMFMDEWGGQADIALLLRLRAGLAVATDAARAALR